MFSARMIQMIESNWDRIATRAVEAIRRDPRAPSYGRLDEAEIRQRAWEILRNLGWWLSASNLDELHQRYVVLGQLRHSEGVPEMEVIRKIQIMKRAVLEFCRDQRLSHSAVEIYAEYEVMHMVDKFFDEAIYAVVRGYEMQRQWEASRQTKKAGSSPFVAAVA